MREAEWKELEHVPTILEGSVRAVHLCELVLESGAVVDFYLYLGQLFSRRDEGTKIRWYKAIW